MITIQQLRGHNFLFLTIYLPQRGQFLPWTKAGTLSTTYPPHLVYVVIGWPLRTLIVGTPINLLSIILWDRQ